MKRFGNLYPLICTTDALLQAYQRASDGKRSHRACFEFGRNLGSNLAALQQELSSGTYQPMPCNRFWVVDGRKPRLIEAPAFRDMVVQHAAYAVISPLLEARYIATNFACRPGFGTHKAADWLQTVIRRAPRSAWLLHIDVRKFFYSLDRAVLQALLARIIKCPAMLVLLHAFAQRPEPTGVPIGNLLSQTFANLYLSSLDQYCKRSLRIAHYGRYMDDSIMLAPSRATGLDWLQRIRQHLLLIGLEISHYSLQPLRRGANFCGFRTWASGRFVRPRLISALRADARRGRLPSIVSRLGHASRTRSFTPLLNFLKDQHHALFVQLPQSYRRRHHPHTALA
jgi:retron-type reverse transcriptase